MEVFMERDVIAPMRVMLKLFVRTQNWPSSTRIAPEDVAQPARDFVG
jgi:hypothetical protein